jgi:threonine synthase
VTTRPALIERYRDLLPVGEATPVVSLGEGGTPLVPLERLSQRLGLRVLAKLEGMNPTASFKDRGMTMAVSKAVEEGASAVICASTGNTSASAAAYAARAGLTAAVVIPEGKIAAGKLAQALVHGARVLALEGGFDDALSVVRRLVERHPIALVNSLNEYRIDGQRTAAFEVCDELGDAPDALCIPVGNAGNVSAYWLGFLAYREAERSRGLPRHYGFQASGAAPLVDGAPVARPETVATAIRIGNPARGEQALAAMRESGGGVAAVTDSEILEAYRLLAAEEGVFCEPASAASVAGLLKRAEAGDLAPGETVVCVLTGHGLKDPDTAIVNSEAVRRLPADLEAVEEAVFG